MGSYWRICTRLLNIFVSATCSRVAVTPPSLRLTRPTSRWRSVDCRTAERNSRFWYRMSFHLDFSYWSSSLVTPFVFVVLTSSVSNSVLKRPSENMICSHRGDNEYVTWVSAFMIQTLETQFSDICRSSSSVLRINAELNIHFLSAVSSNGVVFTGLVNCYQKQNLACCWAKYGFEKCFQNHILKLFLFLGNSSLDQC